MSYSQKYSLVSFINPVTSGDEFDMADWPLHVTLADVFAIDLLNTNIETKLEELLSGQLPVITTAGKEANLGTARVVLLNKTEELAALHECIVALLEENGVKFNTPEYTKAGFMPHCTVQKTEKLESGKEVMINSLALVDMFHNKNWQQRKILNIFSLEKEKLAL